MVHFFHNSDISIIVIHLSVLYVGAMANGHITLNDIPEVEEVISLSGYPLRYMYTYVEREREGCVFF